MSFIPQIVVYVNSEVTTSVVNFLAKQLLIHDGYDGYVLDGYDFDGYVARDGYFTLNKRIIVKRDFWTMTDRSKADVVIHIKHGLATIERTKIGPPGLTLPVANITIYQLLNYPYR